MPFLLLFALLPIFLSAQSLPAAQEGRWGCIDTAGHWVVAPEYDYIEAFDERGLSRPLKANQLGLLHVSGEWLLPCAYSLIHPIRTDLFAVEKDGRLQLINQQQELLFDSLDFIPRYLSNGFFELPTTQKSHLGHRHKGRLSPSLFDQIRIHAGVAAVHSEQGWGILDSNGHWAATPRFERWRMLSIPSCFVLRDSAGEWLYRQDSLWLDQAWDSIEVIRVAPPSLIRLQKGTSNRLLLVEDKQFIGPSAQAFQSLGSGLYAYQIDAKWGFFTDTVRTPCFADELLRMGDNLFRAAVDASWGLCNTQGEWLLAPHYSKITAFEGSIALGKRKDGSFDIINKSGEVALSIEQGPLVLSENSVERRSEEKLSRWSFQSDGKTYERLDFNNIQRLSLGSKGKSSSSSPLQIRPAARRQSPALYQLFWSKGDSARPVSPPIYEQIYLVDGLSFYIGRHPNGNQLPPREQGLATPLDLNGNVKHNNLFDLMDSQTGQRLLRVQELFVQDFQQSPLARCVLKSGFFGLIDRSGKLVHKSFTFIKAPRQGFFPVVKKGKWETSASLDVPRDTLGLLREISFGRYSKIVSTFENNPSVWARIEGGEWNLLDSTGKAVLMKPLSYIDRFYQGQAIAKEKNWGIINRQGDWLLAPAYDGLAWVEGNQQRHAIFTKNIDSWGILNTQGRVVLPARFEALRPAKEGLFAVKQKSLWGFANKKGKVQIPCTYLEVQDFSNGLAAAQTRTGWGYIRPDGSWQLQPEYQKAGDFSQGHSWVRYKGSTHLIDKTGTPVFEKDFYNAQTAGFGLFWLRNKKGWALYNSQRSVIFKKSYISPHAFDAYGRASIRTKRKGPYPISIIDTLGKVLVSGVHKVSTQNDGSLLCTRRGNDDLLLDSTGAQSRPPASTPSEQALEEMIPTSPFEEAQILASNKDGILTYVRSSFQGANYRLFSPYLSPLCEQGFDKAYPFEYGLARVRRGWTESIVHPTGIFLQPFKYNQIRAFHKGYALTRLYRSKGIYQRQSQSIIADNVDYIERIIPGIFRIESGRALGYLRSDGTWIWPLQDCYP